MACRSITRPSSSSVTIRFFVNPFRSYVSTRARPAARKSFRRVRSVTSVGNTLSSAPASAGLRAASTSANCGWSGMRSSRLALPSRMRINAAQHLHSKAMGDARRARLTKVSSLASRAPSTCPSTARVFFCVRFLPATATDCLDGAHSSVPETIRASAGQAGPPGAVWPTHWREWRSRPRRPLLSHERRREVRSDVDQ